MPTVTISMPTVLDTTASERKALKDTFQTKIEGILEQHQRTSDDEVWNVGAVKTQIVLVKGKPGLRRGAKKRPAKKSPKKK